MNESKRNEFFGTNGTDKIQFIINHFEGHKELTRKDDLFTNLKTQLIHDGENIFDYMPVSFSITIPEGKYSSIDNFLQKFLKCFDILNQSHNKIKDRKSRLPFD